MKLLALLVACTSMFAQGIITTFAGADHTFTGDGQPAHRCVDSPTAVALDGQGNVYICSSDQNVVVSVTPDGIIHLVAGTARRLFPAMAGRRFRRR